jgi:hypothetical protein
MGKKIKFLIITIGFVIGVLSYWFTPYNQDNVSGINIWWLMGLLSFFSTVIIGVYLKKAFDSILLFICIGFVIAILSRIFFDISNDPSSHNLFPFEIIFTTGIVALSSFAGSFVSEFINKQRK